MCIRVLNLLVDLGVEVGIISYISISICFIDIPLSKFDKNRWFCDAKSMDGII